MISDGADIVDIGGESSRPGAEPVPVEEEIRRVVPVIEQLKDQFNGLISVDTRNAETARAALEAGAHIVNDITALNGDAAMPDVVAAYGAGVVLMHMQGEPRTMQQQPHYDDVVTDVLTWLQQRMKRCLDAGISKSQMVIDPGIGFGKTVQHNVQLLQGISRFVELNRPVLIGLSRKSFLGALTGGRPVEERLAASLAGMIAAVGFGAHIFRVHDVKESCDAVAVADTLFGIVTRGM